MGSRTDLGGKDRLGSITKHGNRYLRWLLVTGAMAVIRYTQKHGMQKRPWLGRLTERRPTKVAGIGDCQWDRQGVSAGSCKEWTVFASP